jgi:hypothetical protein
MTLALAVCSTCVAHAQFYDMTGDGITDSWVSITPTSTRDGYDSWCGWEWSHAYTHTGEYLVKYAVFGRLAGTYYKVAGPITSLATPDSFYWCDSDYCGHFTAYRLVKYGVPAVTNLALGTSSINGPAGVCADCNVVINATLSPAGNHNVNWYVDGIYVTTTAGGQVTLVFSNTSNAGNVVTRQIRARVAGGGSADLSPPLTVTVYPRQPSPTTGLSWGQVQMTGHTNIYSAYIATAGNNSTLGIVLASVQLAVN